MRIEQRRWTSDDGWDAPPGALSEAGLVLVFGGSALCSEPWFLTELTVAYPGARLVGCSTAGEIFGTQVTDETIVSTAIAFDGTAVDCARVHLDDVANSFEAGEQLARALNREGLVHVLVFSDGLTVNGSDLVEGLTKGLPAQVSVTGGLSGDGDAFLKTWVILDGVAETGMVVGIGLYGDALKIGYASLGGWDSFGPERLITRSKGNVLFELDGKSALELYKKYLGEHAEELPAAGLLFPLCLRTREGEAGVVRTILAVSEEEQSMTFAGDVPEGAYARLMKANFDRLIDGAIGAAKTSHMAVGSGSPDLALLISCVGRKMVLKQRVEEEVEGVREIMGPATILAGFYSYGEISPFTPSARCELHNQTMTITTFSEG